MSKPNQKKKNEEKWIKITNEAYEQKKLENKKSRSTDLLKVKNVFCYSKSYCLRTNKDYLDDVETSIKDKCVSRGVKGESVLGLFAKIPEQILLDKMHTTARGAQEDLLHLWFNPNFSHKSWYIGSPVLRLEIDKRLSGVKYPLEFHRTTKSINDFATLKCSELENIEFYIGKYNYTIGYS